ncbi:hypothetical protein CDN99_20460 [Roseateles aquatilis]|uniref:DUF2946 domain-containing protein n=1 Tax=Roseateles aquatilis TaxID=431061 RepID=A0A246J0T3_9BURK|nr:DUF2946 family protein [Roseateles aquatilis]OWQ86211.1 hypothetical protein CDN99_20460 [Roseateles aquatilis]
MDAIVEAALKKWPNVPHCYGWLALDARGDWYMRDERIQAAGPFPRVKGSRIVHDKLISFIHRNYGADEHGAWFFQNGPQRVYLQLEAAPWVWRLQPDGRVLSHTDREARVAAAVLDEADRLFLETDLGLGLVHTQDMGPAADAIEAGRWALSHSTHAALIARHGVVLDPVEAPRSIASPGKA